MGNVASFLPGVGRCDEDVPKIGEALHTPIRGRLAALGFDPRSPTSDIDRTPIVLEEAVNSDEDAVVDPRSPSAGITRTPFGVEPQKIPGWDAAAENADKESRDLAKVLDYDVDMIPLMDPSGEQKEDAAQELDDDALDFTLSSITTSTPTPSARKQLVSAKTKKQAMKENVPTKITPGSGPRRVPFGDVNASPRLHLINRQKMNLRSEIQRNSIKMD